MSCRLKKENKKNAFSRTKNTFTLLLAIIAAICSRAQPEYVGKQECLLFQNASDSRPANKIMELMCKALNKAPKSTLSKKTVNVRKENIELKTASEPRKDTILFVARRFDILEVNLTSRRRMKARILPLVNTALAIAVDYDAVDDSIYWSTTRRIHRSKRNETGRTEMILSNLGDAVDGIAVDWIARNLYWTDKTRSTLSVSRLNGNFKKTLLTNLSKPRAIALDPRFGKIYFTEWGSMPKITSAAMNGEDVAPLLTNDIVWPNGLAIDYTRNALYFADAGKDRIEVINLDGSGRKVIADKLVSHIFGLSYLNGALYWTDWKRKTVVSMRLDSLARNKIFTSVSRPMGLIASHLEPLEMKNGCSTKNGGCSHLCFYTPQGVKCGCPDGKELEENQRNCSS